MMKAEYETVCAEVDEILRTSGIYLPLSWIVSFILEYAETGLIDPDELQDMSEQIRSELNRGIEKD